jgi:hypothetical protein
MHVTVSDDARLSICISICRVDGSYELYDCDGTTPVMVTNDDGLNHESELQ